MKERKSCILCPLTKNKEGAAVFLFAADERKGRAAAVVFLLPKYERKEELYSLPADEK